jgi:hypothetical protein
MVGYYNGKTYRYWESKPLPPEHPESALMQFLTLYLSRSSRYHLYGHNAGDFDWVFVLRALLSNFPEYSAEIVPSQSTILKLVVRHPEVKGEWVFLDSKRLLPGSLDALGNTFAGRGKVDFGGDYDELMNHPLRYDYLKNDCVLLYDVLAAAFVKLEGIGGQVGISAASTSLATYRRSYQEWDLPMLGEHSDTLSRGGYCGGRCEVIRPDFVGSFREPLHCYDVNSMYPYAMTQPQPVDLIDARPNEWENAESIGFVRAKVKVDESAHIPILPLKTDNKLLFPVGEFEGVFSSVELRLADELGQLQSIEELDSVYYLGRTIFADYVRELYQLRDKSRPDYDKSLDIIAKILLNSLYGKFGSNEEREAIHIRPTMDTIVKLGLLPMSSPVTSDAFVEKVSVDADYMLPHIAAWVTSLSRTWLGRGLNRVGEAAFYCDTDSIYTTACVEPIGTSLGQWKDEYAKDPIVEAHFVAPKVYWYRHASGTVTNRAKGFSRFGERLETDTAARLAKGQAIEVSSFSKTRTVINGKFGLQRRMKRIYMKETKRKHNEDGSTKPWVLKNY